jgi:N-acetyl-gamma-glutamyl-phosphate reductase
MIRTGIIGGSGYTGGEIARLICGHPHFELELMTSRRHAGLKVSKVHPFLEGFIDFRFDEALAEDNDLDLVFLATPHGASMDVVPHLLERGFKVVDMSGDYRLGDPGIYRQWYGMDHRDSGNLGKAVYGLPELFKEAIASAQFVANPGCYPTCAILATAPLFANDLVQGRLIVDAKSGTSGAGAEPSAITHHPNCGGNVKPYKVGAHRHTPEIEMALERLSGSDVEVIFTPHLVPIVRGILCTCYAQLKEKMDHEDLFEIYDQFYKGKRFMRVNGIPQISSVVGSNFCEVGFEFAGSDSVVTMATLDNLTKGGAGQAVQNANIMFRLEEWAGLNFPGLGV